MVASTGTRGIHSTVVVAGGGVGILAVVAHPAF